MARKPMVTRTITSTKVNVLCLNVVSGEPFNTDVTLPRTYKDDKALMREVSKLIDNDEQKAVHVVYKEEVENLYGMSEQDFITMAQILPPRGANSNEETEETEAE